MIAGAAVAALIVIEKGWVASVPTPLAAVIEPVNVLAVVGVPEIRPLVELIERPVGRPVAENVGAGLPVATTWKL